MLRLFLSLTLFIAALPFNFIFAQTDTLQVTDSNDISTLSIIGVGDIMLGTRYPSKPNYLPPNQGKNLLDPVRDILTSADVTFGNLEGCFLSEGEVVKKCKDTTKCYAFAMPEEYGTYLKDAGFDLMSLSNNHLGDFGEPGRLTTIKILDDLGIASAGQLIKKTDIFEHRGLKIGLAAFSPNKGTTRINDYETAKRLVSQLDKECDIVIVSFHGGAEGADHQHVTREFEEYYGENRGNVHEFSHLMIDAGADIIFGHGPHVVRAVELYKERFIIYSMGNFCTYARFNLTGAKGLAPIVKVNVDKMGVFQDATVIAAIQRGEGGPKLDPEKRVIQKLITLTETDFPDGSLTISEDGIITRKK